MDGVSYSKKWLLIIFISSISVILVSSYTVPILAHTISPHDDTALTDDSRAILLIFSGNGGGLPNISDIEGFMHDNMGTHHESLWHRWHHEGDYRSFPFDCDKPCNWSRSKQGAIDYVNAHPEKKIVLAGYSFGGGAATFVGYDLANSGRQIEGIHLTDPVGPGAAGNSRTGIMQVCDENNPIDPLCTRGQTSGKCSNHFDPDGNPFKEVGVPGSRICGKDMNQGTCPAGTDSEVNVVGGKFCVAHFECPTGTTFNRFICHTTATGPLGLLDSTTNCPSYDGHAAARNIYSVCSVRQDGSKPYFVNGRVSEDRCPPGMRPSSGIFECGPFACPTGMVPNAVSPQPTQCVKTIQFTCPMYTEFNSGLAACVVKPSVINHVFDGPDAPNCFISGINCENTCPFGMLEEIGVNECNSAPTIHTGFSAPHRVMNENIKGIAVSYQTNAYLVPTDNVVFPGAGPWHFYEWEPYVSGFFKHFLFTSCIRDEFTCHGTINFVAPLQTEFIDHLKSLNKKPTISITSETHFEIMEGESKTFEINTVSRDDTGVSETIGKMKLFPRLNSLDDGVEPSSIIDDGAIDGDTIEKLALFSLDFDDGDGPDTLTKTVWVEDNGWPCDDCSIDDNDGGATGKWNKAEFTIKVHNVPPTPILVGELGQTRTKALMFNAIDPSSADQNAGFKYEITLWDGEKISTDELAVGDVTFPTPQINVPGEYTFQITAEDKDGGISEPASFTLSIPDSDGDGIADGVDTLPEEFSDDFASPEEIFCSSNGVFNSDTGKCESDTAGFCPSGTFFNSATDFCERPPNIDPDTIVCENHGPFKFVGGEIVCGKDILPPQLDNCPAGTFFEAFSCILQPPCPAGTTENSGLCTTTIPDNCPAGFTHVFQYCITNPLPPTPPSCPVDTTFNFLQTACVVTPTNGPGTNSCPFDMVEVAIGECGPTIPTFTCASGLDLNPVTNQCETQPADCTDGFVLNSATNLCEADIMPCPSDSVLNSATNLCESFLACPSGYDFNADTNLCESLACPISRPLNPVTNKCEPTYGTLSDRGDQDISILEEKNSKGIFFNADEGGGDAPATIIACNQAGQIKVDSGDSGNITCGSITVSIVSGSVDVQFNTNVGPATVTMGALDSLTFDVDTLKFINNSLNPVEIKIKGITISLSPGETRTVTFPTSKTSYQDPNLGDVKHGKGHDNGFCMNQNCINVDGFFNHFPETIVPQGSTQTFSLLINCPRGVNTCNHATIEGVLPGSDFYAEQWGVTLDRQIRSDEWDMTINNSYGEIGEVTTTVQEVDQTYLSVTYNIEFLIPGSIGTQDGIGIPHENNRHLHVTVWDNNRGLSNYIFNEGVYVNDIYAYPQVDTSYDKPIELEPLCHDINPNKRYTCAFDKVREWTIQNAEKALLEIEGKTELDLLNEEFLVKFRELKQAIVDDNSEKILELKAHLDELGSKIHNLKQ